MDKKDFCAIDDRLCKGICKTEHKDFSKCPALFEAIEDSKRPGKILRVKEMRERRPRISKKSEDEN